MRVIIENDPASASKRAADFIAQLVKTRPECVLGLATGSTPLQIYAEHSSRVAVLLFATMHCTFVIDCKLVSK